MSEESKENQVPENEEHANGTDVETEKNDEKEKTVALAEYKKVRSQFDNVLNKHILRLIEIDTESRLQFDTCTVACLVLLVERDREIKNFPNSPPRRYIRETFLNDLNDIGLELDDDLMETFETLVKLGYVGIDQEEKYSAQISTLALVKFIDNLFSGMPGLNLVAYIIQCIDEILSGRKELKENLSNFEQTLVSRGVAISKQNLKDEEKETIKKTATTFKISKESLAAAEKLKRTNVQKLASLRTLAVREPSQQKSAAVSQVKELFPRREHGEADIPNSAAVKEATQAAIELEQKKEEIRKREEELRKAEEANLELERRKKEIAEKEGEIKKAELAAREAEIVLKEAELRASQIAAREAQMAAKEAELEAKEAELKAAHEKEEDSEETEEDTDEVLSIEDKIAAFEAELAMPCPVCSIGKIVSEKTEKEKEYFACTNKTCKFVSWSKPYHFQCPLCKNPYLVEFTLPDGLFGLKCPRAVCSFNQQGIQDPQTPRQPIGAMSPGGEQPKKKKKIIRRKKR
ncbi:MAG: hypothetical protein KJ737_07785 [Proteobacteria bacterium]|nr:hypothetical protein [Pseudomonadota bacterium]